MIDVAADSKKTKPAYITRSEFMEGMLMLGQNRPYSLTSPGMWMEYLRPIIDCPKRKVLIMAARQQGKSTMEAGQIVAEAASQPNFDVLYGTADGTKLKIFSVQKLRPFLQSPAIRKHYMKGRVGRDYIDNVWDKRFNNDSMIMIRNASVEAQLRAPTVQSVKFDEIQDMMTDYLYVAEEAMFTSPHKLITLAGTPKSMQNIIEGYWQVSTQNEWMIPCQHCDSTKMVGNISIPDKFWNCIGIKNCSRDGLVCARCGRRIHPEHGQWVRMKDGMEYEGFRLPQPISPFCDFQDLMDKIENPRIPLGAIMNEKFGISWETADRFLTQSQLQVACAEDMPIYKSRNEMPKEMQKKLHSRYVVAGIDWALNIEGGAETVLVIGLVEKGKFLRIFYLLKLPKSLSWDDQVLFMGDKLEEFNVDLVACDWGQAGNRGVTLAKRLGKQKVVHIHYTGGSRMVEKFQEGVQVIHMNRTLVMSDFRTNLVNDGQIIFPHWKAFSPFAQDFLVETIEEDHHGNLKLDHPKGTFDDTLHASIYANLARKIILNIPILEMIVNVEKTEPE